MLIKMKQKALLLTFGYLFWQKSLTYAIARPAISKYILYPSSSGKSQQHNTNNHDNQAHKQEASPD
jgi:hypothetical protein